MPQFNYDGLSFHYRQQGAGLAFVFQHGLGADVAQPLSLFAPPEGVRMIAFDCRAHGETQPVGAPEKLTLAGFADDLSAFLDHLAIDRAVVGGISMGAAVALKFARTCADRVLGLIQSRPAWLVGPNYENAARFSAIAKLLLELGPVRGKQAFLHTQTYRSVQAESPDAAASLCGQFDKAQAVERAARLERIPLAASVDSMSDLREIIAPTLVLASRHDPIHPYHFGDAIAQEIPRAEFHEITAKCICSQMHADEMQQYISAFLKRNFL
ncbi:MAG: alpha/beta hydrolase [Pirellulales bacterium]|nr:alpha/beta hydrolase [Pirellulales bacterium]